MKNKKFLLKGRSYDIQNGDIAEGFESQLLNGATPVSQRFFAADLSKFEARTSTAF